MTCRPLVSPPLLKPSSNAPYSALHLGGDRRLLIGLNASATSARRPPARRPLQPGAPIAGPMVLSRGNRRESFKAALYHSWPLPQSACNRGWFSPLFGSIGLTPILQSSFFESGPVGRAAGCLCRVQVATYVSLTLSLCIWQVEISQCRGCSRRLVRPAIVVFGHGMSRLPGPTFAG